MTTQTIDETIHLRIVRKATDLHRPTMFTYDDVLRALDRPKGMTGSELASALRCGRGVSMKCLRTLLELRVVRAERIHHNQVVYHLNYEDLDVLFS